MKISTQHKSAQGQTSLEYLLLLGVVAIVVIAAFAPHSLIDQIHNAAGGYYNTVTRVIMDSDNSTRQLTNGTIVSADTPAPINGGWCPIGVPPAGGAGAKIVYRLCECPAPAFGGAYCSGNGNCPSGASCVGPQVTFTNITSCSCPADQTCDARGQCIPLNQCPANMYWDPQRSSCQCEAGMLLSGCTPCPDCGTSSDGQTCTAVTPPANMNCNTSSNQFQCNTGTIYIAGSGCTPCAPTSAGKCTTSTNAQTCVALTGPSSGGCPKNMYCDTTTTDSTYNSCQCEENSSQSFYTYWDGTQCQAGSSTCGAAHPCNSCTTCVSGVCQPSSSCVVNS